MEAARLIIEVTCGVIPGTPEPEFTRRWAITSAEWDLANQADAELLQQSQESGDPGPAGHAFHAMLKLSFTAAEADEYARLMRNPQRFNWVRTEWLWL